jgi:DNA-binding NarL/FixJ family response regulator
MRALIVDDEEIVRELLASVVEREFEFKHVEEAADGEAAWELFQEEAYDFVVLDLMLPELDGLSLARRMLELRGDTRILALSSECDDYTIREVNRSGILGFVHKREMALEVLFEAFNEVSAGHTYYSKNAQDIITKLWEDPEAYYKILSEREFQVVRAIAQGNTQDEIAEVLEISAFTVRRHKHNAMRKLNVSDEASLLRFALKKGIVKYKGGLDWTDVSHRKQ